MGLGRTQKREFKMMSTCITKKRRRLMQVELQPLGGGTNRLPILYYVPFHEDYIQMSIFP